MKTQQKTDALQLVEFLETFLPALDSRIPTRINEGGCGIFAKLLYENLKKAGFETKIVFLASEEDKSIIENICKNNKYGSEDKRTGFRHCMVSLNDFIYFDSMGVTLPPQLAEKASKNEKKGEKIYVGEVSEENLEVFINHTDSWCEIFDRDCVPQIQEELSKLPEEFEKFKKEGKLDLEISSGIPYTKHTVKFLRMKSMMSMGGIFRD